MAGAELGAILPPDGATFARLGLPREVFFVRPLGLLCIHLFYVWRMAGIDSTGYT